MNINEEVEYEIFDNPPGYSLQDWSAFHGTIISKSGKKVKVKFYQGGATSLSVLIIDNSNYKSWALRKDITVKDGSNPGGGGNPGGGTPGSSSYIKGPDEMCDTRATYEFIWPINLRAINNWAVDRNDLVDIVKINENKIELVRKSNYGGEITLSCINSTTKKIKLCSKIGVEVRPLYALWHSGVNNNYYTTYYDEALWEIQNHGFVFTTFSDTSMPIQGYVITESGPGLAPLYRLYKAKNDNSFYTADLADANYAISRYGFQFDRGQTSYIQGYVYTSQKAGTVPIYKLYRDDKRNHVYTTSLETANHLIRNQKYVWDTSQTGSRILGYIYPYK